MVGRPFGVAVDAMPDAAIVRMSGDVTRFAADDLNRAFRHAAATGSERIALDFSSVDYINSSGIALIVGVLRDARTAGLRMLAWGLTSHFREIFEITRIVEFMELHKDEAAALAGG